MKAYTVLLLTGCYTFLASSQTSPPPNLTTSHPNTTTSDSLLDTILSRGHLLVGTTGAYKPFTYLTNTTNITTTNSSYIGADIDMAFSLSNALSLSQPPIFVPTTFANLTLDLSASKFDIAMSGVSLTLPRALTTFFSTPVLRVGKAACVRCEDVDKFQSLEDIDQTGVRVVAPPGGSNLEFDRANLKKAEILEVEDNNVLFEEVVGGRADVVITDVVEVELAERLYRGVLCRGGERGKTFSFEELGYVVPRGEGVWVRFVDEWLRIQLGSGEWNRTLEGWMGYAWPRG